MATSVNRDVLLSLLQKSTSLGVVSDFLKRKQLHHSAGSWEDMFALRLHPYLDGGQILIQELVDLLRTVEEYGRQHIFLFRTTPANARAILDRQYVAERLRSLGLGRLLQAPSLYDFPKHPTIADVRWTSTAAGDSDLIVKEIQAREHFRLIGTTETDTKMTKEYARELERGVNVIRLHRNGQMEVRVASRTGSARYATDLQQLRDRLKQLIPLEHFGEVSLSKAKEALWANKSSYAGRIRFSEVSARNDDDFVLKAAAGSIDANVSANAASVSSMENFLGHQGRCEAYNLWFSKDHTPSGRDVHFLLSGEVNEFAINANCTKEDYEYVLSEIRALNT